MTYFNKANGYPNSGSLPDYTRTKAYKQERERIRAIMHGDASYKHIEKTYRVELSNSVYDTVGKRYVEDGEFSFRVEHQLKVEDAKHQVKKLEV